ncbi:MAG: hypothetical protein HY809_01090 [Nitrospirae bacterium]|nr:hypothetical protein [Nitrospirota bacterium]
MLPRIIPFIISALMIAAHFYRHYNYPLMAASLFLPLLLLLKRRWALRVIQLFAFTGAGVWINTIFEIAHERINYGESWIRMAFILGVVAFFTLFSGLLLNSKKVKERYPQNITSSKQSPVE